MRKLSEGNKTRFIIFSLIIISIILVLVVLLKKVLTFEKEEYAITKDNIMYDNNYEYISLTGDAIIKKKWTGKYYLNEPETGLSYELGTTAITYSAIKNKLNLYGTFYEVALDGEVTKRTKNTEVSNMLNSRLYKMEDRKYLIVSKNISNESGSLTAENYLIIIIDKSGNTLLLNNNIDIKTINAIILETDTFKFDVANEQLIYNDTKIDLKKIIGSTNEYVKQEEKEENNQNSEGTSIQGGSSQASSSTSINVGGATAIVPPNGSDTTNVGQNENTDNNKTNSDKTNVTEVVKSVSLRGVSSGTTYLDVSYLITDPQNNYQVVYLNINGGGYTDSISLDKTKDFYRITGLLPNTDYKVSLGYKLIKSDSTVEEITEDILNVKTLKLEGNLNITKVTEQKIYFNLKIDKNSEYENSKIYVYVNDTKQDKDIKVNTEQAISSNGWTSSIDRTENMSGKLTLVLKGVDGLELTTSAQIY